MLQNAYFLAKIGADTAENEQHFAEILPTDAALLPRQAEFGRVRGEVQGELRFARARTAADLDEACGKTSSQAAIDLPQSRGDAHLDRFKFRIVDVKDPLQKKTLRGSFSAISKPILAKKW